MPITLEPELLADIAEVMRRANSQSRTLSAHTPSASAKLVWTGLGVALGAALLAFYLPAALPYCTPFAACSLLVAGAALVAYLQVRGAGKRSTRELADGSALG